MPTDRERYLHRLIEAYLDAAVEGDVISEDNRPKYRRELRKAVMALELAGLESTPAKIGREEINYLRKVHWGHLKTSSARWELSIFGKYLRMSGNHVVEEMMIGWPQDNRTNVDWLSEEEAVRMLEAAQGVRKVLIHLELRLGMRRVEAKRLTVKDVQLGIMNVHGKGRHGGKWRTLAWAPDTLPVLQEWMELREQIVEEALAEDPRRKIPEDFLIYNYHGKFKGYGMTQLDNMIHEVAQAAGIQRQFGHHTLRRTCGRIMYRAGVPIAEIGEAYGHATEKQTRRYLGLTIDELSKAQSMTYAYLQQIKANMDAGIVTERSTIRVSR